MTTLPSTEAILMEILRCLGGPSFQTSTKTKFITGDASLAKHVEIGRKVIKDIFDALETDVDARLGAEGNLMDFANAYKGLELGTWTYDADERQVLWMLLCYFYIPGLARFVSRRTIDCRMDRNMSGGRFWYLPEPIIDQNGKATLYMPVAQVVDWLLDLLEMSVEEFAKERSYANDGGHDGLRLTLDAWRTGDTPHLSTIQKYFPDGIEIRFKGAFSPGNSTKLEQKLTAALEFVDHKRLSAERLRNEIPMTASGLLESVLDRRASDEENSHFVKLLADRYAPPSPRTIRRYLRIATAVQDGYICMLKALFPGVQPLCADASKNKLLQVTGLYKHVYNLTVAAWQTHGEQGEDAEDAWFETQLAPQLICGPLLSILPSSRDANIPLLAEILKRHFSESIPGAALEDLLPTDEEAAREIEVRHLSRMKAVTDELTAATELAERLKSGGPWAKLKAEMRFNVVAKIVASADLSERISEAALTRLDELSETPAEAIQVILAKLNRHLNGEGRRRTNETKHLVEALLNEAKANPGYERWKAPFLHCEAKHLLAQNYFKNALKLFRQARESCKQRSFGRLLGQIAMDCFALQIADQRLIQNDQETCFRDMLRGDIFAPGEMPVIEDTARELFVYFWDTLYKPYPGIKVCQPRSEKETRELEEPFLKFLMMGDRIGFMAWIGKNFKRIDMPFRDVEGNSLLMFLIKRRTKVVPALRSTRPDLLQGWREYLGLLIQKGPANQLIRADFKAQTPLMLLTAEGDAELVRLLLSKGADPDKQDYQGRTALHSAVKSRVSACVDALLDHPCRTDLLTIDQRSALHTAAWCGNVHAINRIIELAPELAWQEDSYGFTPLQLAENLLAEPEAFEELRAECRKYGNICATKQELEKISVIL